MTTSLRRMLGRAGSTDMAALLIVPAIFLCACGFVAVAIGVKVLF
jgi:hypothetical protein